MDATWRDTWAPNLPAAADQIWRERRIASVFVDQVGAFCLVSEVGGSIRGFAHLSGDEVTSLHVDPKSKRLGIGGALMTGTEFQIRALGYARLRIETEAFNTSAHGFYGALGYTETRRFIGDVIGDVIGFEMPCLEMTKAL